MPASKHIKILRSPTKYASFDATKTAMDSVTILEGEPFIGYYNENSTDKAVLGVGGKNGTSRIYFPDESKLNELSATFDENYKNTLNQAVMLMLANYAGMPLKLNNAEWKYVYTDSEDHVLFGKKQDNTWTWGDDTDDLLDDVLDLYAQDDTLFSNIYRLSVCLSLARMSGTLSEIQNPEWKWVVTDSQDKVLMGIKTDNSWYLGCTINELLDCVLATYAVGGATYGTFANKPTSPSNGQMYFASDKGYPIWYNGTAWVNSSGTVES